MTRAGSAARARRSDVQIDKRRSERQPVVVRVDYSTVDSFFSEFTRNINEGGLFIETDEPGPVDSVVSLQFRLPGSEDPVRVNGRVVWVDGGACPGMGIEFEDLDPATRARINRLVRSLRTKPGGDR